MLEIISSDAHDSVSLRQFKSGLPLIYLGAIVKFILNSSRKWMGSAIFEFANDDQFSSIFRFNIPDTDVYMASCSI